MRIVCIGDSLTYGYGVTRTAAWPALVSYIWQKVEIINRGINGDTTDGMLARFEKDVLEEYPDVVFVMGGSNDIFFSRDIVSAKNNIAAMVFRCMHKNIEVILGIPLPVYEEGGV